MHFVWFQYYFKGDPSAPNIHQEKELSGPNIEEEIFKTLKETLSKAEGNQGLKIGESDFLIVSLPLKSIIHIEAKRSQINDKKKSEELEPWQKAAVQLEKMRQNCWDNIPFKASDDWRYSKWMYFQNTSNDQMAKICQACQAHILNPTTNFKDWWRLIDKKQMPEEDTESNKTTYLEIIHFLFHQMFIQDDVLSGSKLKGFHVIIELARRLHRTSLDCFTFIQTILPLGSFWATHLRYL